MENNLLFEKREDFRTWLTENATTSGGVWLIFGKTKQVKSLKAGEALEEALCFATRRKNSKWSEKNKKIVDKLEQQGLMTDLGREKIAEAKQNGQWANATEPSAITDEQIAEVAALLKKNAEASKNFENMSPSVKKTYTRAYLDAKTEAGRTKRLAWMIDRLEKNLRPM